jgi:hypothetical protein
VRPATPPSSRELGLPGVIGAPRAMLDIRDGQRIEVDALKGSIRILQALRSALLSAALGFGVYLDAAARTLCQ